MVYSECIFLGESLMVEWGVYGIFWCGESSPNQLFEIIQPYSECTFQKILMDYGDVWRPRNVKPKVHRSCE